MYERKADWERSDERKALLEKLRTFKKANPVVVAGSHGVVESTDEQTLSVRVEVNKRCMSFSVRAVEHYNAQP